MKHEDLSIEKIESALQYLDYEDRDEWLMAAFAIRSELGQAGFDMWDRWSSQGSTYNRVSAKSVWKSARPKSGGVGIGSLIHAAIQKGFVLGEYRPVSAHVVAERAERRKAALIEAKKEEEKIQKFQAKRADDAKSFFAKAQPCDYHTYLDKKEVSPFSNVRIADWEYKDDEGKKIVEKDALIIPLMTFEEGIVSLQAIFNSGEKKILWGAKKSGAFHVIGDESDVVVIVEGFATGVTVYEATGFQVYAAIDAGNLYKVAISVRNKKPNARIIIGADNDAFSKVNMGLKQAEKAACEVDADIVYPTFKDITSRPTDFNDLAALEGLDAVKAYFKIERLYKPVERMISTYDAWDLEWIEDEEKVFNESDSEIKVAQAAKIKALKLAKGVPAFISIEVVRNAIDHPLLSRGTHLSIMKQVQWSIFSRKRIAMSAIKPASWGNKHIHRVVSSLEGLETDTPVTLVAAPMGAGKTKSVIKPFSKSWNFLAIAHRRSLISDLSERLEISSYETIKSQDHAASLERMAVCLPSTQSAILKPFIDSACNIAIDEISQNLRFTASSECKVQGADQDRIFTGLQDIISQSKKVIVCDASIDKTTLDFMESSRPDETFTIVEQAPSKSGRSAFIYGDKTDFLTRVKLELEDGGKVWLAVESADKAEVLAKIFSVEKTLVVTSRSARRKEVKEFLDNIEEKSREYDLVIASPAISSGVSIEHKDDKGELSPHFTMIAGMASGHSVCFSDFAQMLGRVRYVKDYHIHLIPNNLKNNNLSQMSILTGLRQAAAIEGGNWRETAYSSFRSHIICCEDAYKADFANGLVWFLEYFCFDIKKGFSQEKDEALSMMLKELADDAKKEYKLSLMRARKISRETADDLESKIEISDEDSLALSAYKIRRAFNLDSQHDLSELDIDMYADIRKVERFGYMLGLKKNYDDSEMNISLRRFEKAKVEACKVIFEDFDLNFITEESMNNLIAKVSKNENRFLFSALKLIPSSYGEWKEDKKGQLKELPLPTRAGKPTAAILEKFGLSWKRSNSRSHGNIYKIDEEKYQVIKKYAEMRFS